LASNNIKSFEKLSDNLDILIVNPGAIRHDYITEHLGIAGLKSYVNSKGFRADTLDMAIEGLTISEARQIILAAKPKMLGLSLLDDSKNKGLSLAQSIRKGGYTGNIVAGGYFPTFNSKDILCDFPEIDFIVRGEGELTLAELMTALLKKDDIPLTEIPGLSFRENGEIIENTARPLIKDLDILPPVDRKYARAVLDSGSQIRLSGTRGCWGQCTFCDIIGFYRSSSGRIWRYRSIPHLLDEIESLMQTFKTDYFIFNDDQFLLKGSRSQVRIDEMAEEIKHRGLKIRFELMCRADTVNRPVMTRLKEAGLTRVFLGLESFVDTQLQQYKKGISARQNFRALNLLHQLKIDVIASVILTNAYTTLWDLIKQFIILFELKQRYFNSPNCRISINKKLEVYKGSAVYHEYNAKGILIKDDYLRGYDYRLKFWTGFRLALDTAEEKLGIFVVKPAEVLSNAFKAIKWFLSKQKRQIASAIKFGFSQIINPIKWS